ncbi:unnamed protein product [Sphagnum troendelagicum]
MFQPQRGVSGNGNEVDQYLVSVDRCCPAIGVHRHLVVVVGPEGIAAGPLLDGHGLPRNAGHVDAIRASKQRRRSRIHMHSTVVVIVGVYHDNVPAFVDECRYPQSAGESRASSSCPRTGRRQQCGVGRPGA